MVMLRGPDGDRYGQVLLYFVLNVIMCLFSGGGMVMWTHIHCFDFFSCNLISICAKLQTSSASPSILINLFIKLLLIYHVAKIINHDYKCSSTQYKNK